MSSRALGGAVHRPRSAERRSSSLNFGYGRRDPGRSQRELLLLRLLQPGRCVLLYAGDFLQELSAVSGQPARWLSVVSGCYRLESY